MVARGKKQGNREVTLVSSLSPSQKKNASFKYLRLILAAGLVVPFSAESPFSSLTFFADGSSEESFSESSGS